MTGWTLAAVAIVATLAIIAGYRRARVREVPNGVTIVATPGSPATTAASAHGAAPDRPVVVAPSPERALAHLRQAYPMLSGTTLECINERCILTGTILPLTEQADLDKRQEMLLGGLKTTLAANGYDMRLPFQMDEIDFNRFHIQAELTPRQP